jgi:hypothetical protein
MNKAWWINRLTQSIHHFVWSRRRRVLAMVIATIAVLKSPGSVYGCKAVCSIEAAVLNADQKIIIIWDEATKTQHFIRQASFKSDVEDFGFVIPSPSKPELSESGDAAFSFFNKLTAPAVEKVSRPISFGCSKNEALPAAGAKSVSVIEEKEVAGYKATVLSADTASALVDWLKENGFAYSPDVEAWAKPYVEGGWIFTALKLAKKKDDTSGSNVSTEALRMSFKTDRPLFPYREGDSKLVAEKLKAPKRLLRIYFLAAERQQGELENGGGWTGSVTWAGPLAEGDRKRALELLKLPETTGPEKMWLTEFDDQWPYRLAYGDLYFSKAGTQETLKKPPIKKYKAETGGTDASALASAGLIVGGLIAFRRRLRV